MKGFGKPGVARMCSLTPGKSRHEQEGGRGEDGHDEAVLRGGAEAGGHVLQHVFVRDVQWRGADEPAEIASGVLADSRRAEALSLRPVEPSRKPRRMVEIKK